jgi:desampylase
MVLQVTSGVIGDLCEDALRTAPEECCGLLLGTGETIERALPTRNVAAEPLRHFEIDPAALLAAHKAARAGAPQVLGYYHSHPTGNPVPSATDVENSTGDLRIWAIVAGAEVAFWRDTGDGFEQIEPVIAR